MRQTSRVFAHGHSFADGYFPSDALKPFCGTYAFPGYIYDFNCESTSLPVQVVEFLNGFYVIVIDSIIARDATTNPFGFTASVHLDSSTANPTNSGTGSASQSSSTSSSGSGSSTHNPAQPHPRDQAQVQVRSTVLRTADSPRAQSTASPLVSPFSAY